MSRPIEGGTNVTEAGVQLSHEQAEGGTNVTEAGVQL